MILNVLLYWFKIQAKKAAYNVLGSNYSNEQIKEILNGYWKRYNLLKTELEDQPTLGGRLMVNLAAMSVAFYNEFSARGIGHVETTKSFYEISWIVYKKLGKFSWWMAGFRGRTGYSRLKKATELFRAFPFNNPSYKWQNVSTKEGVVGFDCLKCPVAEYFKSKGLADFCVDTWCALDFPLAEQWDSRLIRASNIAGGAQKCDFRWIPKSYNHKSIK